MLPKNAAPEALGLLRIVVFGCWLWHLLSWPTGFYAGLPREFFDCIGLLCVLPAAILDAILSHGGMIALKWIAIVFVAASLLGVRPFPLFAIPAAILVLLFDGVMKSYAGFVNHAHFGILYSALLLSICPAADGFSMLGRKRGAPRVSASYAQPMIAVAMVLAFAYAFVAGNRFLTGGIGVFTGDAFKHWIMLRSLEHITLGPQFGLIVLDSPFLLFVSKVGFFVTTLFELLSPLALLHRRFRYAWLVVIGPFHLVTMLTMNILFWQNLLLILVLFTPIAHALSPRITPDPNKRPIIFVDGECVMCHGISKWLMKIDRHGMLRLGILQGETARELGLSPDKGSASEQWSATLWDPENKKAYRHSTAVLRGLIAIGGIWGLAGLLLIIPVPVRDAIYRWVARNRYKWFGKRETCSLPSASDRERLVK